MITNNAEVHSVEDRPYCMITVRVVLVTSIPFFLRLPSYCMCLHSQAFSQTLLAYNLLSLRKCLGALFMLISPRYPSVLPRVRANNRCSQVNRQSMLEAATL